MLTEAFPSLARKRGGLRGEACARGVRRPMPENQVC